MVLANPLYDRIFENFPAKPCMHRISIFVVLTNPRSELSSQLNLLLTWICRITSRMSSATHFSTTQRALHASLTSFLCRLPLDSTGCCMVASTGSCSADCAQPRE